MATYYYAEGGTAANKAAATGDGDISTFMSPAVAVSESAGFSAGDSCLASSIGGTIRLTARMDIGSSGSSGSPITWGAKSGESPVIKGSVIINSASYNWTESSTSGEWFCRTSADGNPSLIDPGSGLFFVDGTSMGTKGTLGALTDQQWGFGDNDSLGYDVLYFCNATDPGALGVDIEVAQVSCMYAYGKSYLTIDGISFQHGHLGEYVGGLLVSGGTNVIVQNCEFHWCNGNGVAIKGDYHTVDNCTASYCGSHNISAGGFVGDPSTYMTLSNNVSHHSRSLLFSGSAPWDGYGLKFLFVTDSVMFGNTTYANGMQGIDLDGSHGDAVGCYDCHVYDNLVYGNYYQGILVEIFSDRNKVYRNLVYDNGLSTEGGGLAGYEIGITHVCHDNEIFNNVIYMSKAKSEAGKEKLIGINEYDASYDCHGTLIYGNTMVGGGYADNAVYIDGYTSAENTIIKNNSMTGFASVPILVAGTGFTGFYVDYNCLRRDPYNADIMTLDWTGYTLAELASSSYGGSDNIGDAQSFTNAGSHDYSLASDSPCIGVALNTLGAPYNNGILPSAAWPSSVTSGDRDNY